MLGTVSRNERFHKAQIEIFQSITRRLAKATGAALQFMSDVRKPDIANYSEFGTQLCRWTKWMRFQKIFHVLSDDRWQFFDLEGDHIQETQAHTRLDCLTMWNAGLDALQDAADTSVLTARAKQIAVG